MAEFPSDEEIDKALFGPVAAPQSQLPSDDQIDQAVQPQAAPAAQADVPRGVGSAFKAVAANPAEYVPFVGGAKSLYDSSKLMLAANRLRSGDSEATPENPDYQYVSSFLKQQQEDEKPTTLGYKVANIVLHLPAFAGEMWATGGLFSGARAATQEAALKVANRLVKDAAEKWVVQAAAKTAGTIVGAAAQTAAARASQVAAETIQRMTPTVEFKPDDAGKLQSIVEDPKDGFAQALAKAYGNEFVEVFTEHTGEAIGQGLSLIPGVKKLQLMKEAVIAKWIGSQKGTAGQIIGRLSKIKERAAWDGMINEMGEERLGEVLKGVMGIEPYKFPSGQNLAAEAIAFSVPGAGHLGLGKVASLSDQRARGNQLADLQSQRGTPERQEALAQRAQELQNQNLTDAIMASGQRGPNAIPIESAAGILPREQGEVGTPGGERSGVGPSLQGPETAQASEAQGTQPGPPLNLTPPVAANPLAQTIPSGIVPANESQAVVQTPPPAAASGQSVGAGVSVPGGASPTFTTKTPSMPGRKVVKATGHWDVIDASDPSIQELGGITDLQTRNRYTQGSTEQVVHIATTLDPEDLGDNRSVLFGAPVLDDKGERLAGYGRLAGILLAYQSNSERAGAYRQYVQGEAQKLGLAEKAAGMQNPILVRRATHFDGGTKEDFADLSNAEPGLEYTTAELARMDAKMILGQNLLAKLSFDDKGNINREFKDAFYNGMRQKTGYRATKGQYSSLLDTRIGTAILTSLFVRGEDEHLTYLVRSAVEDAGKYGSLPQVNGLIESAPALLKVGQEAPGFDIASPLARAMLDFTEYRKNVLNGYVKNVGEFMDQLDLFDLGRTPESGQILQALGSLTSAKKVAAFFQRYAELALKEKPQETTDLFGATVQQRSAAQLLTGARNENQNVPQAGGRTGQQQSAELSATAARPGGRDLPADIRDQRAVPGSATNGYRKVITDAQGDLVKVLQRIAQDTANPFYKRLADRIIQAGGTAEIILTPGHAVVTRSGFSAGMFYSTDLGEINVAADRLLLMTPDEAERDLLHESIHVVTAHRLLNPADIFTKQVGGWMAEARKAGITGYGMTNEAEFVASLSDDDFREQLSKVGTLWQRIVEAIRKLLGLKPSDKQLLQRVLETSLREMEAPQMTGGEELPLPATTPQEAERHMEYAGTRQNAQDAMRVEAESISGQVTFPRRKVEDHMASGVEAPILRAALHEIGYDDLVDTEAVARAVIMPEELTQGLQRLANSPLLETYRKEAGTRFYLWRQKLEGAVKERDKLQAQVFTPAFQQRMMRVGAMGAQADLLEDARKIFDADTAKLLADMKKLAETDARAAAVATTTMHMLEREGYSEAVKSAIRDMVETLANDETAMNILYNAQGTPDDMNRAIETYRRLKPYGGPADIIVHWAAEIVTRATEITRGLLAIQVLQSKQDVREAYDQVTKDTFDEWRKNPRKVSRDLVKAVSKFATKAERARAAFAAVHKEFEQVAKRLTVMDVAAQMAQDILNDQETKDYEKLAYGDVVHVRGTGIDQDPDAIRLDQGIVLPDGTRTKALKFYGDTAQMDATFDELRKAATAFQDAIVNSPEDPQVDYWQAMSQVIEQQLMSSRVWTPVKVRAPFAQPGPMGMMRMWLDSLGTPVGGLAKVAFDNFAKSEDKAKTLYFENNSQLTNLMTAAARSHDWGQKNGMVTWYAEIGRELFDSWQRPEGGLKVGEKINGIEITPEDVALARMQAKLHREGFQIVQKGLPGERGGLAQPIRFKTSIGPDGVMVHVMSTQVTDITMTRHFNTAAIGFVKLWQTKEPAGKVGMLNARFWKIVVPFLKDRANLIFGERSPHEAAYGVIGQRIQQNGLAESDRNVTWLVDQVAQIEPAQPGENAQQQRARILADLISEFDQQNQRLFARYDQENSISVQTLEQRSSFTKARGDKLAGFWLYDTGWKDGNAFANFAHAIHGYYYERAALALQQVIEDLARQKTELEQRRDEIMVRDSAQQAVATKTAVKERGQEVEKGQSFDDWRELDKKIRQAQSLQTNFASVYAKEGQDATIHFGRLRRIINAVGLGVLVSELNALRNVGFGWVKLGRINNHNNGLIWWGYPQAFGQMWFRTIAPYLASTAVSVAKTPYLLAKGGAQALGYQGRSGLAKGPAQAIGRFLEPLLSEMAQRQFDRLALNREMFDRGIVNRNYAYDDFVAKSQNLREGGVIRETPLYTSALGNMGSALLTIYDAAILTTVGRPLFPRWADNALNHAGVIAAFDSIDRLEKQLRRVHEHYKGTQRFDFQNVTDPKNRVEPKEAFGGWYGGARTMNDMVHLQHWFEHGNIAYQEAAMRFMKKLEAGQKDAELLTEDERWQMAEALVEDLNKGVSLNRPIQFKKGGLWDIVAPLQGWNVAELHTFIKHFSRAVDPKTSKAILWMSVGLLFTLPAIAAGGFGDVFNEWFARLFYKYIRGEERATRQPWEREGIQSQAIGWVVSMANAIPFVQSVVNTMLNDMPNRASADPVLFIQSKAIDIANYIGGVVKTHDMTYGLPRLIAGFLPLSSVFLNRLPAVEGSLEALDARRLMTRYGPQDLLRDKSGSHGLGVVATPLTPYGEKMLNAAMRGDDNAFLATYQEAVEKARELGLANPERTVRQMFAARNPYDRAFKHKLDPDQHEAFLARLNPDERQLVQGVEAKFSHAAGLVGAPSNFEKEAPATPAGQTPSLLAGFGAPRAPGTTLAAGTAIPTAAGATARPGASGGSQGYAGLSRGRSVGRRTGGIGRGLRSRTVSRSRGAGLSRGLRRIRS